MKGSFVVIFITHHFASIISSKRNEDQCQHDQVNEEADDHAPAKGAAVQRGGSPHERGGGERKPERDAGDEAGRVGQRPHAGRDVKRDVQ